MAVRDRSSIRISTPLWKFHIFQNGRDSDNEKPPVSGGLARENRSQGCILQYPDRCTLQEVPVFPGRSIGKLYQFNCLPFGLASAPWVFTKTLRPVIALGRELGMRLVVYIDDILLMAESKEKARDQANGLVYLMNCLGFTVNREKTTS